MKKLSIIILLLFSLSMSYADTIEGKSVAVKIFNSKNILLIDPTQLKYVQGRGNVTQLVPSGNEIIYIENWNIQEEFEKYLTEMFAKKMNVRVSMLKGADKLPSKTNDHYKRIERELKELSLDTDYILLVYPAWLNHDSLRTYGYGILGFVKPTMFAAIEIILFDVKKKSILFNRVVYSKSKIDFQRFMFGNEIDDLMSHAFKDEKPEVQAKFREIVSRQPVNFDQIKSLYEEIHYSSDNVDEDLDFIAMTLRRYTNTVTLNIKDYRPSEIEFLKDSFLNNLKMLVEDKLPSKLELPRNDSDAD